jgi:hypothetical protein
MGLALGRVPRDGFIGYTTMEIQRLDIISGFNVFIHRLYNTDTTL